MYRDWLSRYLELTSVQESPELFHLWSGLSCLSAVVRRNIWMNRGFYTLYPNMYVVLVAPSGRCRKTTASDIAVGMLRDVGVSVVSERITPAALCQILGDQVVLTREGPMGDSTAFIYAGELSVLFGKDAELSGIIPILTSLYGCPKRWEYITKTSGKDYLHNVWVGLLGASSPEWLATGFRTDSFTGGMFARVIFVVQWDTPRKEPDPHYTEEHKRLMMGLLEDLERMKSLYGEMRLSEEAKELFNQWYMEREPPEDPRMMSFYEREHDHVLKVAMLLALSRGDLFMGDTISEPVLRDAIGAIDEVKRNMPMAFRSIVDSPISKGADKIIEALVRLGGEVDRSLLLRKVYYYMDGEMFDKAVSLLEGMGKVRTVVKGRKRVYKLVEDEKW